MVDFAVKKGTRGKLEKTVKIKNQVKTTLRSVSDHTPRFPIIYLFLSIIICHIVRSILYQNVNPTFMAQQEA